MNCDWRLNWLLERSLQRWHQQVCKNFDEARALGVVLDMSAHYFYYILTGAARFMFSNAAEAKPCPGQIFWTWLALKRMPKRLPSNLHQSENLNEASYF